VTSEPIRALLVTTFDDCHLALAFVMSHKPGSICLKVASDEAAVEEFKPFCADLTRRTLLGRLGERLSVSAVVRATTRSCLSLFGGYDRVVGRSIGVVVAP